MVEATKDKKSIIDKCVIRSNRMAPKIQAKFVKSVAAVPEMGIIDVKSFKEVKNLRVTQVFWNGSQALGLAFNDGSACKAGTSGFKHQHTFDPAKKITKIVCIIHKDEWYILQIHFYHNEEVLVVVGSPDWFVEEWAGRKEEFEIAEDE